MVEKYVAMQVYLNSLRAELEAEEGQDLIEYALLAFLISVALATVLPGVATAITNVFNDVVTALS